MTVVGLGAWCDVTTADEYRASLMAMLEEPRPPLADPADAVPGRWSPVNAEAVEEAMAEFSRSLHFDVQEFATLADGSRLTLHRERGFGVSAPGLDLWSQLTLEDLERDVRAVVLPDDDDSGDEHPYEWLSELLRGHGVDASPEHLRSVPYVVEFSERLRAHTSGDAS